MKKYWLIIGAVIITTGWNALCWAEGANPELAKSLKSNAHEPNFLSIIFALLFVIFLIYITGLIYSKLNLVGAKTVKDQLRGYNLDRAVVLSTTQLGQGKNLHVIEINNKQLLIGATANSINLIKELDIVKGKKEATRKAVEEAENAVVELEVQEQEKPVILDEFDVHKKYL